METSDEDTCIYRSDESMAVEGDADDEAGLPRLVHSRRRFRGSWMPVLEGHPVDEVLANFKPMFELVNKSLAANYCLDQDVCVDERIVGFKGRHRLKQYVANKKKDKW